ncbi:hypothetical protein BKA66DRAFT_448432 [Pyrenochaeta sp. MPI-SDFR-AT-0127]|nr:hypothetical protein BKA66DRAFT_448432 [Pyrenochaeta sp. MPI-SDFR-AT-0127]
MVIHTIKLRKQDSPPPSPGELPPVSDGALEGAVDRRIKRGDEGLTRSLSARSCWSTIVLKNPFALIVFDIFARVTELFLQFRYPPTYFAFLLLLRARNRATAPATRLLLSSATLEPDRTSTGIWTGGPCSLLFVMICMLLWRLDALGKLTLGRRKSLRIIFGNSVGAGGRVGKYTARSPREA